MSDRFRQGEQKQIEQDHVDALRENALRDRLRREERTSAWLFSLLAVALVMGNLAVAFERVERQRVIAQRDEWKDISRSALDNFHKLDVIDEQIRKERDIMILLFHSMMEQRQREYAKDFDRAYANKCAARAEEYEAKAHEAARNLCGNRNFMILENSVRCEDGALP